MGELSDYIFFPVKKTIGGSYQYPQMLPKFPRVSRGCSVNDYMDWNTPYSRVQLFVTILVSPRTQTAPVTVFVVSLAVFRCNASRICTSVLAIRNTRVIAFDLSKTSEEVTCTKGGGMTPETALARTAFVTPACRMLFSMYLTVYSWLYSITTGLL